MLNDKLAPGEPLMSNLGPALAWQTNHPVVHLALTPADVEACRRRLDVKHIVPGCSAAASARGGLERERERAGAARTMTG